MRFSFMSKISVVVPVYNTEKFLRRCLDSIINQTLRDIEIICINDGSLDNSLEILQNYAQQDKRIKIINNKQIIKRTSREVTVWRAEQRRFTQT